MQLHGMKIPEAQIQESSKTPCDSQHWTKVPKNNSLKIPAL